MNCPSNLPPSSVERGLQILFEDHVALSDFIFNMNGANKHFGNCGLVEMREMARRGDCGPNDPPTVWLLRFLRAIKAEVEELEGSISWKWWRKDVTDLQNVRVELIDIFHFIISAAVASGMDGNDFASVYYEKRRLNYDRQTKGFHPGDNKVIGLSVGREAGISGSPDAGGGSGDETSGT